MEFSHRMSTDILNVQEQQQTLQETTSPTTTNTPASSSSSTTTTTTHWAPQQAAAAAAVHHQREHMFEKVVTPSDVGKLNRLVIPKQHAERYFPLDPAANDKGGLLLNFEEGPTGRPWRFRYSYWNSSQSYVMTKGWSRFVKDKHLDAGDTVSFSRSPSDPNRLFIDWRRRPLPLPLPPAVVPTCWGWSIPHPPPPLYFRSVAARPVPMSHLMMRVDDADHDHGILDSVPVRAAPHVEPNRQMRLFGVNIEEEEQSPPSPMQWRLSPSTRGPPAPRRSGCS